VRAVKWRELVKVCEGEGCQFDRQRGDHYIMTKPGLSRPVVIPRKRDLKEDIVLSIAKTLGLTRKQILERLG
jgi:predicted RNA binding protein YcfA (HicA-like mRNA interferase family)